MARSRSLPFFLFFGGLGIVAILFLSGTLDGLLGPGDREAGSAPTRSESLSSSPSRGEGTTAAADAEAVGLRPLYGDGDRGALAIVLFHVDGRKPVEGADVRLIGLRGVDLAAGKTAADGRILLGRLMPAERLSLEISGEAFSPLTFHDVRIFPGQTTDLGEVLVGTGVILRGRVVDTQDRPVAGANVLAYRADARARMQGGGILSTLVGDLLEPPPPDAETTSNEKGEFAFTTLSHGTYKILARRLGLATATQEEVFVESAQSAYPITLRMRTSGRIYGTVKDDAGSPVPGAEILAVPEVRGAQAMAFLLGRETARTDDHGNYSLDTLERGQTYRLGLGASGFPYSFFQEAVTLTGDVREDLVLVRGGSLAGEVVEENSGAPIAGAKVIAVSGQPAAAGQMGVCQTRSDENGRFLMERLLPGTLIMVSAQAKGFAEPGGVMGMIQRQKDDKVEIRSGEVAHTRIELRRGGRVEGVVRLAGKGTPLQGVQVVAATPFAALSGALDAVSDAEGAFVIEGVPDGDCTLLGFKEGFANVGSGASVKVSADGPPAQAALEMTPAANLEGVVLDPAGEPAAGVRVTAVGKPGEGFVVSSIEDLLIDTGSDSGLTDVQGRFRIEGLAPKRSWMAEAVLEGYMPTRSEAVTMDPGETSRVEITLLPAPILAGHVVDERGRWVAGASVRAGTLTGHQLRKPRLLSWEAEAALGDARAVSDDEGRFRLRGLRAGVILLKVEKDGYATAWKRNVRLAPGDVRADCQVKIEKSGEIEGVVLSADGRPLERAWVMVDPHEMPPRALFDSDEEELPAGQETEGTVRPALFSLTDAKGAFTITGVPTGRWSVVVWRAEGHEDWSPGPSEAAIRRGVEVPGAAPVEFRLPPLPEAPPAVPENR